MSSKDNQKRPENETPAGQSKGKREWVSPSVEDLGVGATALGGVPMGTPDGLGNVKS